MKHNKAVIFDMDGVLIDSEKFWAQAESDVFTSLGAKVTEEHTQLTKAMTTVEVTNFWFEKYPWKNVALEDVEQMVITRVMELIEHENCDIQGVKPFVEQLKSANYKIGLATNSPHKIISVVLKKLGVSHLFDAALSAEFELKGKPDPAVYLKAAEMLSVNPARCIAIEDSYSGMLAAKNAGMVVIGFTNGNNAIDFEIADYKIHRFHTDEAADIAHLIK